ncbi:hypothetical protein CISG_03837 [Coccidioides immitis RMSCC 3703]|uniref:Uncharacterized protein n=1 Tax=Coccidioides immitis RMSCC 3703 TaxID=454286 RepID=A0A0J8QN57_COCIT|nr:hypothetical protein CISG_03837 [Coccidioides immitis RMSCC 3703]
MVVLLRASTGWVMEEHVVGLLRTAWLQLSWYHHLNVVHYSLPLSHGDELQKKYCGHVEINQTLTSPKTERAQSHFSKAGAPRERLVTITAYDIWIVHVVSLDLCAVIESPKASEYK